MGFKELSLSVLQNLVHYAKFLTFIHVIKRKILAVPMNILISLWWGKTSVEVGQTQTSHWWEVIGHGEEDVLIGNHRTSTENVEGWGTDMSRTSVSGLSVWVWELSLSLLFCFCLCVAIILYLCCIIVGILDLFAIFILWQVIIFIFSPHSAYMLLSAPVFGF